MAGMTGGRWVLSLYQSSKYLTWWFKRANDKLLKLLMVRLRTGTVFSHCILGQSKLKSSQQDSTR